MNEDKFKELKARIKEFNKKRNWDKFHDPKNLALSFNLEAAEVLELFQWTLDNKIRPGKEKQLAEELADVFYWLILLADHYKINLIDALNKKMEKRSIPKNYSQISLIYYPI